MTPPRDLPPFDNDSFDDASFEDDSFDDIFPCDDKEFDSREFDSDRVHDDEASAFQMTSGEASSVSSDQILSPDVPLELVVEPSESGMRLDAWLAQRLPRYSRVLLRQAITNGSVKILGTEILNPDEEPAVAEERDSSSENSSTENSSTENSSVDEFVLSDDDSESIPDNFYTRRLIRRYQRRAQRKELGLAKPAYRVRPNECISIVLPELPRSAPIPEEIPLDILYEDDYLVVINKPSNMVVHPSRGHWAGTLVGALAFHFRENLSTVRGQARPGIVHRLDRDTTGVILVAKTDFAHMRLAAQFESRRIQKEYIAICTAIPIRDRDIIDAPIGPHPHQSEKMAIRLDSADAKPATTFYEVLRRYRGYSLIKAQPKTGRTHQIRLHFTYAGFPILCDRLYGGRASITSAMIDRSLPDTEILTRQALHAHKLRFFHPETDEPIEITAPLPEDMKTVIGLLEKYRDPS